MIIALALFTTIILSGLIVMTVELRNAPDAYQDQTGFHIVWRNNRPELLDISCIWELCSEHPAMQDSGGRHRAA